MPNFAQIYASFRGSKNFLIGLSAFVACWLTFHFTLGYDKDFGALNTILSTEASISLAFFTMVADRQAEHQKETLRTLLTMSKAIQLMLEDHSKILRDLGEKP